METAKDLSKKVKEIRFFSVVGVPCDLGSGEKISEVEVHFPEGVVEALIISERAENIKKRVRLNNLWSIKYELSNKYNPNMKFLISMEEKPDYEFDVEIMRII
ncbi:unnamed protein product [Meloidogyne enterolobii]|uniref:Uncharacterized protein n=1 Tax=Meloidogyne enterolobii TaxID=390850 RepID=A0ACB0Y9B4_MELEN